MQREQGPPHYKQEFIILKNDQRAKYASFQAYFKWDPSQGLWFLISFGPQIFGLWVSHVAQCSVPK